MSTVGWNCPPNHEFLRVRMNKFISFENHDVISILDFLIQHNTIVVMLNWNASLHHPIYLNILTLCILESSSQNPTSTNTPRHRTPRHPKATRTMDRTSAVGSSQFSSRAGSPGPAGDLPSRLLQSHFLVKVLLLCVSFPHQLCSRLLAATSPFLPRTSHH